LQRRSWWFKCLAGVFPGLLAWQTWQQLRDLESGREASVRMLPPLAELHKQFGIWPPVLLLAIPAAGLVAWGLWQLINERLDRDH
jgi:hypothetical protein